jgi:hypothetical protein
MKRAAGYGSTQRRMTDTECFGRGRSGRPPTEPFTSETEGLHGREKAGVTIAANPCAAPNCGASRNGGIHSRFHPQYHAYMDPRKPGLKPMREGMSATRQEIGYEDELAAAKGTPCQIVSPVCTGVSEHLHEPMPRGRAGGLEAAVRMGGTIPACDACNGYVSANPVWAKERVFLFSNTLEGRTAAAEAKEKRAQPAGKTAAERALENPASSRKARTVAERVHEREQEGRPSQPPPHRRSRLKRD